MSWKKWMLIIFLMGLGTYLAEGFTGWLGSLLVGLGFGMAGYQDGKEAGARGVFTNEK